MTTILRSFGADNQYSCYSPGCTGGYSYTALSEPVNEKYWGLNKPLQIRKREDIVCILSKILELKSDSTRFS
jgi:hypothetical protein